VVCTGSCQGSEKDLTGRPPESPRKKDQNKQPKRESRKPCGAEKSGAPVGRKKGEGGFEQKKGGEVRWVGSGKTSFLRESKKGKKIPRAGRQ